MLLEGLLCRTLSAAIFHTHHVLSIQQHYLACVMVGICPIMLSIRRARLVSKLGGNPAPGATPADAGTGSCPGWRQVVCITAAFAQTDGSPRMAVTLNDYNASGASHWTAVWVTTKSGASIKTLWKQGTRYAFSSSQCTTDYRSGRAPEGARVAPLSSTPRRAGCRLVRPSLHLCGWSARSCQSDLWR
jgi:hypothetical protein